MSLLIALSSAGIILITGVFVFFIIRKKSADIKIENAEKKAQHTLEDAAIKAQSILAKANTEGQDVITKARLGVEEEVKARRQAIAQVENRVLQKEKYIDTRETHLSEKESMLEKDLEKVKNLKKKQEAIIQDLSDTLEKAAGYSKEEAKKILLTNVEREVRQRAGLMIKQIEDQARIIANRKAREIITDAIQRTAIDHISEITTSVVQLPDDDMKGRIIGREGRNIRVFEAVTGVDVIIDDTPGAVVLSSFDPIRREIAKLTLSKLISDGRIHPTRIEELVEISRKNLKEFIIEKGEQAADQLGLQFSPKIIELLGKLHFRTSYGQNILTHSIECAHTAAIMAQELQVNAHLAKRGALLHDIGKALDFEQDGTHVQLGKEVCEKANESEEVLNCIEAHHEDVAPETVEAILVMVADRISSVRPGARRESLETYIKRLEKLETVANSFEGIDKAYAIQAGREIRVVVKPDEVDDPAAYKLALDIAKKIESDVDYPGEVKVSIIRETRAVGVAK
ncbi:MAG: ribonuclease Y [bacterium]|nr:ribonuclease Y [bacterium]